MKYWETNILYLFDTPHVEKLLRKLYLFRFKQINILTLIKLCSLFIYKKKTEIANQDCRKIDEKTASYQNVYPYKKRNSTHHSNLYVCYVLILGSDKLGRDFDYITNQMSYLISYNWMFTFPNLLQFIHIWHR